MEKLPIFPPEVQAAINGCLAHANDLLTAANAVLTQNLPHITYHLAALALEEVGKAGIIKMSHIADKKDEQPSWISRQTDDHVKKLFWAVWGPSLGKQLITKEQIEDCQSLAQTTHEKRLRGLYVDIHGDLLSLPKDAVTEQEAKDLVELTEARIQFEGSYLQIDQDINLTAELDWFLTATDDSEKLRIIMGRKSMEKLVELGQPALWIKWLHDEFEQAELESQAILERELKRSVQLPDEHSKEKWKVRIRLQTNSHSIRPKSLNIWNQSTKWINLHSVDKKKNELLVDVLLPQAIPLDRLYWASWGAYRRFVCALNIGSFGFFWWYVPEHIGTFAEAVKDIENNMIVKIERNPILKLDWGRSVLDEKDWLNIMQAMNMLPYPSDKEKHEPFDHYLTGLGFLSKTDIHMQFEPNAYSEFFHAFKSGMRVYGAWDGKEPLESAFNRSVERIIPTLGVAEQKKYLDLAKQFDVESSSELLPITLSEVGMMKVLCDGYFNHIFHDLANARAMEPEQNKARAAT